MPRHRLFYIAIVNALSLAGCHNAGTEASSSRAEQSAVASSGTEPAQGPAPGGSSTQLKSNASVAASNTKHMPEFRENEAWVLVESERIYIPVIDDLGEDLLAADTAAKGGKGLNAATSLRKGAAYLLSLVPPEDAKAKAGLTSAVSALNSAAEDLALGHSDAKQLARVYQQAFDADLSMQWLALDIEDSWQPYSQRPGQHLDRALSEIKASPRAAATDIREANSYLRVEELRHPNDLLSNAVQELATLADQVDLGKVKDPSRIEDAIADSGHALAATHYHVAVDAWEHHDQTTASRQLKESVVHLKHAASWVKSDTKGAVDALGRDAELLLNDARGDVSAFAKRVESELTKFKSELEKRHTKPN
jgi:hypothetical protein